MKATIILTIVILTIISCSSPNTESIDQSGELDRAAPTSKSNSNSFGFVQGNAEPQESKLIVNRKIIWTARLKFQVMNVDASTKAIQQISKQHGGFISSMDLSSTNYQISNTIQIRIANDKFENIIDEFKKEAIHVDGININSNDVTEEFIDIEIRLKTKKEVRDRYIDVLRNKAGKVKDIIAAEEAIRTITEEIESKEGRLRYLQDKVNFSTITITIYQKVKYKSEPKIYEKPYVKKLLDGLKNGWSIITTFVLFLANIWPVLILVLLLVWKGKWIKQKLRK